MNLFWASILVGTLFGFIGSIAANLIHNPLLVFIDKRRLSSKRKRFPRETAFHQFLCDVNTGKIDKHIYVVRICATMVMGFLSFLICTGVGVLLAYISQREDARALEYMFGIGSGFFLSFYLVAAARYQAIISALSDFEKVDAEYKQRWTAQLGTHNPSDISENASRNS